MLTVSGPAIIAILRWFNVPSPIQQMVIGAIIVGAVWLDGVLQRRTR